MSPHRRCLPSAHSAAFSPARPAPPACGLALALLLGAACANPRLQRGPAGAALAPPPSMLSPSLAPEPAPKAPEAPAPAPKPPALHARHSQVFWDKPLFFPDVLTPGAPSLVLLSEAACTGCRVVEAALPGALDASPALHAVTLQLSPAEPSGAALRDAFEADALPVAVLFAPTGQARQVAHGAADIQALLEAAPWGPALPVQRRAAAAPGPAAPPAAGPAGPGATPAAAPEEAPPRIAPAKPTPPPPPAGWQPKPRPAPPSPSIPEEGPYLGPEPAEEDAP